jgi:trans-aconitate 2-methyltransferase
MTWDPATYNKFKTERALPFEDLFHLLNVQDGLRVLDLGCGTGQLTAELAERLPHSDVLGIDSSAEMLAAAKQLERPRLRFELQPIETVVGSWDLVFSHAVIQWLDDHPSLMHKLFSLVKIGGQLAVQLPDNHDSLPHRLIKETARQQPFSEALGGWARTAPNLQIEEYAELLYAHCKEDFTIFIKIYPVILKDAGALLEWHAGTALLPYLERLPEELREPFLESYRSALQEHYPQQPVFYPFRRILFAGMRCS